MSTNNNSNDEELRDIPPDPSRLKNSQEARAARRRASSSKQRITIRVDEDVLEEFKELAGEDGSYQTLINLALRQWLEAQDLKEMLRQDLPKLVQDAINPSPP